MPRPKGSPNKITSEVRSKLQDLLDDLIASLDVNGLDANQRIKMLQTAFKYIFPTLKQETVEVEDLPLFWIRRVSYIVLKITFYEKATSCFTVSPFGFFWAI